MRWLKNIYLLASIPTSSNLSIVHIFPLLVASSEAEPGEREWCENRWKLLSQRMWIGNIDRALEVVKEVWRRKDGLQETCEDRKFHQLGGLMVALNGDPNNNSNGGSGGNGHVMATWHLIPLMQTLSIQDTLEHGNERMGMGGATRVVDYE